MKHSRVLICVLLLFCYQLLPQLGYADSVEVVSNVRLWHSPDNTRVVFDVSANVKYKMFSLDKPKRLVVDIENADLSIKLPSLDSANQHIQAIRSGRPKPDLLRFVFELKKPLESKSFVLTPNEVYGHRLVVDLIDQHAPKPELQVSDNGAGESVSRQTVIGAPVAKPFIVAIDAGHGGEDPGASGHRGSREKHITLAIAKRLEAMVDAEPDMRSFMVRKSDYYIKLEKRRTLASEVNADVFVSIHADAFRLRSANGFSVFALSQRGATSAMAKALAAKENASDLIGGVSLADKGDVLAKVLVDLSMTNTISDSVNLGGRVLSQLAKIGRLHSKRVEQAGFAVLKSADIPSILIETGFITNPEEERRLKSSKYQSRLARGIFTAVKEYREQTPYSSNAHYASPTVPSRAAPNRKSATARAKHHKVVRGDSLSSIAAKYGTSVRALRSANKLNGSVIRLGAKLKLPDSAQKLASGGGKTRSVATNKPAVHVVKRGDSLSMISAKYNVTIKAIKSENKLRKNTVYIGQKLRIPGGVAKASTKAPSGPIYHRVKRGDTLSEIAEKYGASKRSIMRANNMRGTTVMLGQRLRIPSY